MASMIAIDAVPGSVLTGPELVVARASLCILGHKAYALFGADLSEGEAEYVTVKRQDREPLHEAVHRAA